MVLKITRSTLLAAVLLVCLLSFSVSAKVLQKLPYSVIQTADLKVLWDTKPKDLLVIDTRNSEEYDDVHITGAVNIPQKKFDTYKHLLPSEKNKIFLCEDRCL